MRAKGSLWSKAETAGDWTENLTESQMSRSICMFIQSTLAMLKSGLWWGKLGAPAHVMGICALNMYSEDNAEEIPLFPFTP